MSVATTKIAAALTALAVFGFAAPSALAQSWQDSDVAPPADQAAEQSQTVAPQQPAQNQPAPPNTGEYPDRDPSALTDFRPYLDPYGRWVEDPTYGTVWVPSQQVVGTEFAPYVTSGHWALTAQNDWIWVSDYPFGWVTFHYGRWVWIPGTGWAWIPGRQYANAWVVWRVPADDYYYVGWAPMPPSYFWFDGYAVGLWFGVPAAYVFCDSRYVFYNRVDYYIVHDRYYVNRIAAHTRVYSPASGVRSYSPPLRDAHIPASAVPRQRVAADPRATAAARRETASSVIKHSSTSRTGSATARNTSSSNRFAPASSSGSLQRGAANRNGFTSPNGSRAVRSGPQSTAARTAEPGRMPGRGAGPALTPGVGRAPDFAQSRAPVGPVGRPGYAAPSYRSAPTTSAPGYSALRAYSTPSYSAPRAYSAPSYSAPRTYSAPSYSAPRTYSAPSYSAPRTYSAPSYSGGGYHPSSGSSGGYHGGSYGGGGHSFGGGGGRGRSR